MKFRMKVEKNIDHEGVRIPVSFDLDATIPYSIGYDKKAAHGKSSVEYAKEKEKLLEIIWKDSVDKFKSSFQAKADRMIEDTWRDVSIIVTKSWKGKGKNDEENAKSLGDFVMKELVTAKLDGRLAESFRDEVQEKLNDAARRRKEALDFGKVEVKRKLNLEIGAKVAKGLLGVFGGATVVAASAITGAIATPIGAAAVTAALAGCLNYLKTAVTELKAVSDAKTTKNLDVLKKDLEKAKKILDARTDNAIRKLGDDDSEDSAALRSIDWARMEGISAMLLESYLADSARIRNAKKALKKAAAEIEEAARKMPPKSLKVPFDARKNIESLKSAYEAISSQETKIGETLTKVKEVQDILSKKDRIIQMDVKGNFPLHIAIDIGSFETRKLSTMKSAIDWIGKTTLEMQNSVKGGASVG